MHRRHALRRPLTSPTPPLPPHSQPPGRGGALKKQSKQSPSSPRVGGREVGEEGRGGEGSGGAFTGPIQEDIRIGARSHRIYLRQSDSPEDRPDVEEAPRSPSPARPAGPGAGARHQTGRQGQETR